MCVQLKINSQRIIACNWPSQKLTFGGTRITKNNSYQQALCNRCPVQSGNHGKPIFVQCVLGRAVLSLCGCQTTAQHWIKILHPGVQEFYPVLGLGSGEIVLGGISRVQHYAGYISVCKMRFPNNKKGAIIFLAGLETQMQSASFFERKRPERKPWPRGRSLNRKK